MANAIKWTTWTARGNVLSSELDALASGSRTNAGTEIANQTNLDQWGKIQLDITFGSAPVAGSVVRIYMVTAPDGSAYEDGSSSVPPGTHKLIDSVLVKAVATAQKLTTAPFRLEPAPTKFIVENGASTGQALSASGHTAKLFTANDEVQ